MYFLIHPLVWINDERMAVHCLESGCIGLHIPSDLEISLGPRDVPRASPSGHLSGLGKSLGRRGCTTQYIPPLGSVRIHYQLPFAHCTLHSAYYNTVMDATGELPMADCLLHIMAHCTVSTILDAVDGLTGEFWAAMT